MSSLLKTVEFFGKIGDVYFYEKIPRKNALLADLEVMFEKGVWRVKPAFKEWKNYSCEGLVTLLIELKADTEKFDRLLRGVIKEKSEFYKIMSNKLDSFSNSGYTENVTPFFTKKHLMLIPGEKK